MRKASSVEMRHFTFIGNYFVIIQFQSSYYTSKGLTCIHAQARMHAAQAYMHT